MWVSAPKRPVILRTRITALVAVAVWVLAPSLVRAFQSLDYAPSTPSLTFSRSGAPPPERIHLPSPVSAVLLSAPIGESTFACIAGPSPTDRSMPGLPFDASPDPTRGPPRELTRLLKHS
jgi:hypothetical protein